MHSFDQSYTVNLTYFIYKAHNVGEELTESEAVAVMQCVSVPGFMTQVAQQLPHYRPGDPFTQEKPC